MSAKLSFHPKIRWFFGDKSSCEERLYFVKEWKKTSSYNINQLIYMVALQTSVSLSKAKLTLECEKTPSVD